VTLSFALTLFVLGCLGAFVAGLLGIGGAIVMMPLLLYVPPMLGVGQLTVKSVTGVTMVQVVVAAVSGVLAHRRHNAVDGSVVWTGGAAMASGSLGGALLSSLVPDQWLLVVFGVMVTGAAALMALPLEATGSRSVIGGRRFSTGRIALVSAGVGIAAGLVGAGGAFLLVPLLLIVVGVPIRVTIGSSLAITALAAIAGAGGKLLTGQVPYEAAILVALGAALGAHLGAVSSHKLTAAQLRLALGVAIVAIAIRVWWNVLAG
jgi:hypothetical protein